jgi:hypothetical protein
MNFKQLSQHLLIQTLTLNRLIDSMKQSLIPDMPTHGGQWHWDKMFDDIEKKETWIKQLISFFYWRGDLLSPAPTKCGGSLDSATGQSEPYKGKWAGWLMAPFVIFFIKILFLFKHQFWIPSYLCFHQPIRKQPKIFKFHVAAGPKYLSTLMPTPPA